MDCARFECVEGMIYFIYDWSRSESDRDLWQKLDFLRLPSSFDAVNIQMINILSSIDLCENLKNSGAG